jgi:cysteate synthase
VSNNAFCQKSLGEFPEIGNHYRLACVHCHKWFEDSHSGFLLNCDEHHPASLLQAAYSQKKFTIQKNQQGLFRYGGWLPIRRRILPTLSLPAVFQSERLASQMGFEKLIIAFSGYWPERGAFMETCSFKELVAFSACARIPEGLNQKLVVASTGNTGRAFLHVGSTQHIPMVVVVPEDALTKMWLTMDKNPCVKLAVLKGDVDYLDSIETGNAISAMEGCYPEGGVRNVARRDGLGAVVLQMIETFGEIPEHYFQAVGTGTGAIGAWETNLRLIEDGRFGNRKMKLHLVQNEPFAIMAEAWRNRKPELPTLPVEIAKQRIGRLHSPALSNRKPAYSVVGGVFDALTDSGGDMYSVTNEEARKAGQLFETIEDCDLDPAAEVTLAGLLKALEMGRIKRSDLILLNLTGGGRKKIVKEGKVRPVKPDLFFTRGQVVEEHFKHLLSCH